MSIIAWLIVGLVAGILANAIYPSKSEGGIFGAIVLGILGGVAGGFVVGLVTGQDVMNTFDFMSIIVATGGALLLVFGWNALTGSDVRTRR